MKILAQKNLAEAVKAVKAGKILAVPTETVFALVVKASDEDAIKMLCALKTQMPSSGKVFTILVPNLDVISKYAKMNRRAKNLALHFANSEVTMIVPKKQSFKSEYFDHFKNIGFRIPQHKYLMSLLKKTGPLLIASANLHGDSPCMNDKEVKERVPGVDVIVRGRAQGEMPTTVLDLSGEEPIVRRQGGLLIVRY